MFPRCMSLLEVRMTCRLIYSDNVTLEYVAVLGECCHPTVILLCLVFVSGGVSLSQVDVTSNILYLSVVDIYWCVLSINTFVFDLFIFRPLF